MPDLAEFLTTLARLTTRHPAVEGVVVWAEGQTWSAQDDTTEILDAEEIAFYAEGLLSEGFGLAWQAIADAATPKQPEHILLMFWQGPCPPLPETHDAPWVITAQATWPPTNP